MLPLPFSRCFVDQSMLLFTAGSTDIIVTVEFKNLNVSPVNFEADIVDEQGNNVLGSTIQVSIPVSRSYKKHNVFVKAGCSIYVKTNVPGMAVRAYKPVFYAKPGGISIAANTSKEIDVYYDGDGSHLFTVQNAPRGMTIYPLSGTIDRSTSVKLTLSRDSGICSSGQILLALPDIKIATIIDVATLEEVTNDGGNTPTDFNVDLAAIYREARDHI